MATWVRNSTATVGPATDSDLAGTVVGLDNATAPVDFDPAAINSVTIDITFTISGLVDDTFQIATGTEGAMVQDAAGAVDFAGGGFTTAPGSVSNGSAVAQVVDDAPDLTQTVAAWEGAVVDDDGVNNVYATFVKNMNPDGGQISIASGDITVTIDYTPAGGGPVTISTSPASVSVAGQTVIPTFAALTVSAVAAAFTVAAQAVSPVAAPVVVQAAPATLSASAQAVAPVQAAFAVQASPANLTTEAQVTNPGVAGSPVTIPAAPAGVTAVAQTVTPAQSEVAVPAVPVLLDVAAQPVTPIQAPLVLPAVPSVSTVAAQPVAPSQLEALVIQGAPAGMVVVAQAVAPQVAGQTESHLLLLGVG